MKKENKQKLRPKDLLCFSDVMDNLQDFKEIDIMPQSYIKMIKEDKTRSVTIIEYSSSQVAVIDNTVIFCHESLERFYPVCMDILLEFRERLEGQREMKQLPLIDPAFRANFIELVTNNKKNAVNGATMIDMLKFISRGEAYSKDVYKHLQLTPLYLKIIELASKIMLCFNGELNLAFNIRIDLILMGFLKDIRGEIKIVHLSLKKFTKSSIGWFYRSILVAMVFEGVKVTTQKKIENKSEIDEKDFSYLKQFWEKEYSSIIEAQATKKKSYKLWEYLTLFHTKMFQEVKNMMEEADHDAKPEIEIFLIENSLNYYQQAKQLCTKDVHNHCVFVYLTALLRLLYKLEIDQFMGDDKFYLNFIKDHKEWVNKTLDFHEKILRSNKTERDKWAGLTMVDFSKMESLRGHKYTVENWNGYQAFYADRV